MEFSHSLGRERLALIDPVSFQIYCVCHEVYVLGSLHSKAVVPENSK